MSLRIASALAALLVASTGLAVAQQMTVEINRISASGAGEKIGSVVVADGKNGVSFKVSLKVCRQRSGVSTFTRKATAVPA